MQINKERKRQDCITMEEYLERKGMPLRGEGEKEEYTRLAIQHGDIKEWSDLFYT